MNRVLKIFGKLFHGIILIVGCFSLLSFIIRCIWDSGLEHTYADALHHLNMHGPTEYRLIIDECANLLKDGEDHFFSASDVPESLRSMSPYYVRAGFENCEVNFYKVPGKGIGYFVRENKEGKLILYWHDYFKSWDSHKIEFKENES